MTRLQFCLLMCIAGVSFRAHTADIDYTTGVFIVNEDWYGHQNSTVNYLMPDATDGDYWQYRVVQTENPGVELGCTNQFGTIWNDRFYFIAKQDKDPGASIAGGRITVTDARTMKVLHQSRLIDESGAACDGRAFCGVTDHKGYVSTSNGVWILDLDDYEIKGQIAGTANPTPSNLYKGQCGSMVLVGSRVFVAHQSLGLLVIDAEADEVVATVPMTCVGEENGIGSVVLSKDGNLWLSVAKNTSGMGNASQAIVKVNPVSLETDVVEIPDDVYPPSNSWYAWTPDTFCASSVNNALYWAGGRNSWFSNQQIFRYDIDNDSLTKIIDLSADGENWKLYGCSMRVHPVTDELYMSLYHEFNDQTYITRRYTSTGSMIKEYPMISNYWFPSVPVFAQSSLLGVNSIADKDSETTMICDLFGHVVFSGKESEFDKIKDSLPKAIYIVARGGSSRKLLLGR